MNGKRRTLGAAVAGLWTAVATLFLAVSSAPATAAALPPFFADPDPGTLRQFYEQLPAGTRIARIATDYRLERGRVRDLRHHDALFHADLDGDGRREWVVGCHFPPDPAARPPRDDLARLVVFRRAGGRWTRAWTSPGLGHEFGRPSYNIQEVESGLESVESLEPPLQIVPVGGRLAIAFFAWSEHDSVGGLPGIYRWSGSGWRNISPQADRFSLRDLDGDFCPEVIAGTRFIGHGSGAEDVPHVYRWDGERYVEASPRFPGFYAQLARRYRERVRALEAGRQAFPREVWERAIRKAESLAAGPPARGGMG